MQGNESVAYSKPEVRMHLRNGINPVKFLKENKRDFYTETTKSGFTTIYFGGKAMYVRAYKQNPGTLNKIKNFQTQVRKSELYQYVQQYEFSRVLRESNHIESSILYKGFCFESSNEDYFPGAVKIDLNGAYWQTCRYFNIIDPQLYNHVYENCIKSTRLGLTGTLSREIIVKEYVSGKKVKTWVKTLVEPDPKKIAYHNIYNRVRKFVDELMIWAWKRNPENLLGYYVDCVWLREFDPELIDLLGRIYKMKVEMVDAQVISNRHGKMNLVEIGGEKGGYDVQIKSDEFVRYKNLYNFTPDLEGININVRWETP